MSPLEKLGLEVAAWRLLGSRMQAAVLCALVAADGRVLSTEFLSGVMPWMQREMTDADNVVKVRICLLREKLGDVGLDGAIRTVRGHGYVIDAEPRARIMARLVEAATS